MEPLSSGFRRLLESVCEGLSVLLVALRFMLYSWLITAYLVARDQETTAPGRKTCIAMLVVMVQSRKYDSQTRCYSQ